ncbi:MAG TPA: winged helix-turn-helix transcriptional regulator [Thermoplasmata archaeon]|nr:winged helix-turn-helix transcriptional regulator [Thermoplasmata archaeon]
MDETDLSLLLFLLRDSRATYSSLARRLKLSIPAVHKRILGLREAGIITKFTANLSWPFLNAVPVLVSGLSAAFPLREAVERVGKHEATRIVVQGSENSLHIQAHLRSIQGLGPYASFCRKAAAISNPSIGIEAGVLYGSNPPYREPEESELDPVDYRILWSLHDNSRKPIADVCQEIRVSPKTVRTRLRRMWELGVAEFYAQLQIGKDAGVLAFFMLSLKTDAEPLEWRGRLLSQLEPRVIWSTPISNAPNALTLLIWSPTPAAHEDLFDRLSADACVENAVSHISTHFDFFETWRDRLLEENATARPGG